ncbi:MAG: aconitase X catalytic domain-containing protein [Methanomassiliicoccales archaeon]|nr:aconitase X catalytic domain-containing protein [Methanomassiliicoccales archaeon]
MHLTRDEELALAGENGPGLQRAMELLVALGRIYDAERLVPIASAHLSGVSYKTIGDGGLDFLEEISPTAKVTVPTTLNPAGMDLDRWREMGVDEEFAAKQTAIIRAYGRMGVQTNCTCTPYLTGNSPKQGEAVAWAESSALSFVNSVLGARTNREGGPGALAAAIVGKTPLYGLHLEENRRPTVVVEAETFDEITDLSLLGHAVGTKLGSAVPYFKGIRPDCNGLKTMAAAMAAAGSVAMFHVEGVTPGNKEQDLKGLERVGFEREDISRARDTLTTGREPDLIALGCPHLSQMEMKMLASMLDGKRPRKDGPEVWFCTSRTVRTWCPKETAVLERFGKVVCDTCMIVAPIENQHRCTATNSAKACTYLPSLCSQKVVCGSYAELLRLIA